MDIMDREVLIDSSVEKDGSANSLKKPKTKKMKSKSPTLIKLKNVTAETKTNSMTPSLRTSRSKTPLTFYLQRRSEDLTAPFKIRSITPFINRQSKEKTPFELGKDIRDQLIAHKMVFDRASYMNVSDGTDYEPARYLTSDIAVLDRASVMDISNVEVIYMVEEYDDVADYDENMQIELSEEQIKKKKTKKGSRKSKSVASEIEGSPSIERESLKFKTKASKKKIIKMKEESEEEEEDENSQPPLQLPKLKLELGGGPKINKKLFDEKSAPPANLSDAKPPSKETKAIIKEMSTPVVEDLILKKTDGIESHEDSELNLDHEIILNIVNEPIIEYIGLDEEEEEKDVDEENELMSEEESETEYVPEPELTAEELAEREAERLEQEELEKERLELEHQQMELLTVLREKLAEIEKWNRIREEEGVTFMNRIKRFLAQQRDDPTNLCFVNHLPNATVMEGKNIRISCSVNGTDLEVKWFKDGKEIHSSNRYIMSINLYDILSLEIMNIFVEDSGEYTCEISNGKKRAVSSGFISVCNMSNFAEKPCTPVIESIEDSYHFMNDELIIKCCVQGTPRPIVTWYRNDIKLKTDRYYTITEKSHGVHVLTVKNPVPRPSGFYAIKAKNSNGEHIRKHIAEFFVGRKKLVF